MTNKHFSLRFVCFWIKALIIAVVHLCLYESQKVDQHEYSDFNLCV